MLTIEESLRRANAWDVGSPITKEEQRDLLGVLNELFIRFYGQFSFGMIMQTADEVAAVKASVVNPERLPYDSAHVTYWCGEVLDGDTKVHDIIFASSPQPLDSGCGLIATHMERDFPSLKDVMVVGVGTGVPGAVDSDDDIHLGDVVVSTVGLSHFDYGAINSTNVVEKSRGDRPSPRLLEAISSLQQDACVANDPPGWISQWQKSSRSLTNGGRPIVGTDPRHSSRTGPHRTVPKVHYGLVASVSDLLAQQNDFDNLVPFGVKAVDHVKSGIANAAWQSGLGYLVVRGISDYGDSSTHRHWRANAACAAATYAVEVLRAIPPTVPTGSVEA